MLKKLFFMLTGGRPMTPITKNHFRDKVSGEMVGIYKDKFGRTYMSTSPWAWFRIGYNSTGD